MIKATIDIYFRPSPPRKSRRKWTVSSLSDKVQNLCRLHVLNNHCFSNGHYYILLLQAARNCQGKLMGYTQGDAS